MMLPALILPLLAPRQFDAGAAPPKAGPAARLMGAAMFKNGFAVTHRTIDVPKTGSVILMTIPSGAMGTLWFTPSEGMSLDSIVVENDATESSTDVSAATIESLLDMNVGNVLTLTLAEKEGTTTVTGKLVSATGSLAVLEVGDTTLTLLKTAILRVEGKGLKWKSTQKLSLSTRAMKIRTSGKAGHIDVVALERGLSWSPSYAVDLQPDGKTLNLVAKATLINDLEDLKDLDCRFVTGFPNLPFAEAIDPLVAGSIFQAQNGFGGGAGGFVGQSPAAFRNQEGGRGANVGLSQDGRFEMPRTEGEALGELFFYPRKGVTVKDGGRAAYTLFAMTAPYETVYAWDLADPAPGQARFEPRILPPNAPSIEEVWQTLRFANTAKVPLTTGPATTFGEGEILGQDTLKYVSPNQTAELRVTRSLDLSPDVLEEEVGRERGFVKRSDNYPIYDRVTVKGTLTLVNRKATAVRVRIRKPFTGEWLSAEGEPKVTTTAAGLRQPNPTGLAEWTKTVAPGETLRLTYSLRLLVSP